MYKIGTVIVELERPIDSDDDYLVNEIADEHYGVARELVYCKDCKWNKESEYVDCPISAMHGRNPDRNFCSNGERKDLPYPITCEYCKYWHFLKRDGHYWCYKHSTYMDGCEEGELNDSYE